jgi:TPR repeat protein
MQTLIRELPMMTLLPRSAFSGQQAQAAQLERQVSALQARLDHCAGVARRWKATRCGVVAGVAAGALMAGVALGAYREPLLQPAKGLAESVGISAAPANADAAYAAYQNNDYPAALRLVRSLAEAGDARAQSLLALMYYRGRGLPQDDRAAAEWFRRAAEAGDTSAQFYLGGMYSEGRGVPQVYAEAARFYQMAAERGDGQAQYNLGLAYARGEGVEQISSRRISTSISPPPGSTTRAGAPPPLRTATIWRPRSAPSSSNRRRSWRASGGRKPRPRADVASPSSIPLRCWADWSQKPMGSRCVNHGG